MKHPITFLFFLLSLSISAQFNTLSNERVIGGSGDDGIVKFINIPNSQNNFLIGISNSDASFDKSENSRGNYDLWLLKIDPTNNIIWEKTIGGSGEEFIDDILLMDSRLYLKMSTNSGVSGEKTLNSFGENDNWLVCLDTNGNILWQSVYGGAGNDRDGKITKLSNNNILISTSSSSGISGNRTVASRGSVNDILLIEINPLNGDIVTQKAFGTGTSCRLNDVKQLPNGNVVILAWALTGGSNDKSDAGHGGFDNWVIMLDEQYNKLTDKCFGGNSIENELGSSILVSNDELYFVLSSLSSPSGNKTAINQGTPNTTDCWVVKTDADLNIIWDRSFGGSVDDVAGYRSHFYNSEELVIQIFSESGMSGNKTTASFGGIDSWFVHISSDGTILRQQSVGASLNEYGRIYDKSNNKKTYVSLSYSPVSGMKTLPSKGEGDIWLFDFDDSDILDVPVVYNEQGVGTYPNPFEHQITFSIPENHEDLMLTIFTLDGKMVYETIILQNETVKNVEIEAKGVLMYKLQGATTSFTGKLITVN